MASTAVSSAKVADVVSGVETWSLTLKEEQGSGIEAQSAEEDIWV